MHVIVPAKSQTSTRSSHVVWHAAPSAGAGPQVPPAQMSPTAQAPNVAASHG